MPDHQNVGHNGDTYEQRLAHARDALWAISPDLPYDDWLRVAMAAKASGLDFAAFNEWSEGAQSYSLRSAIDTWRSIKVDGGIGCGTLFYQAKRAGWRPFSRTPKEPPDTAKKSLASPERAFAEPTLSNAPLSKAEWAKWVSLDAIHGEALAYLNARRCVIPPPDGDLRCHPSLRHWPTGHVGPALVALVTDARSGEPISLHYTWIQPNGQKAHIDRPRLLLGRHRKHGGVIRLWPDEAATTGLAVAEGIESALSIAHAYAPVWACIDAGNLATFPMLDGIECLLIGADHDPSGIRGANACAQRWAQAGREVRIAIAPGDGQDLNDLARSVP